ncbi:MAG: lysylphosphatidylglycerol synthase transmembrane domain-containing protein [Desulfosudaceae bacterium]
MKKLRPAILRFVIPFLISGGILLLLIQRIDGNALLNSLAQSQMRLLLPAVLISVLVNIFLGAVKWRRILQNLGCRLPFAEVLSLRTGCIPFKLVFPMKSSELLKAAYLARGQRLCFTRSVSSLLLDKALNLFVIVCLALLGLSLLDHPLPRYIPLGIFLTLLLMLFAHSLPAFLLRLAQRLHPGMSRAAENLVSAFQEIGWREKLLLLGLSALYQASEFVNTFLLMKAVGITIPLAVLLVAIPAIMIISNLPVTVLGLGTREAAIVFFLAAHGPPAALLSGSILISLVEHVLPVLAGLLFIRSFYLLFLLKNEMKRPE